MFNFGAGRGSMADRGYLPINRKNFNIYKK